MNITTTKCVNGTLQAGDIVIATPNDEYCCLIGRVTKINLLGTPEQAEETANETDDVHVNFLEFDYSENRIKEIEKDFSKLYGKKKTFGKCPIDDVILAPDCLICITGIEESILKSLLQSGYNAACYCYNILYKLTEQTKSDNTTSAEINDIAETLCDTCDNAGQETMSKVAACNCCENYQYYKPQK
jgi:hypothetical protein